MLGDYGAFLLQALPARINVEVNNHLLIQPLGFTMPLDMTEVIRHTMQEVMEDFRPILASAIPDTNEDAEHDLNFERSQMHSESAVHSQTLNAFPASNMGTIFPLPLRAAPPPPAPPSATWAAVPLSDSPSTTMFDFGFGNPGQAVASAPAVLYGPDEGMAESELWDVDGSYDNEITTFERLLDGTGPADDMQS